MVDGPDKLNATEAVKAVVSSPRSLREELTDKNISLNMSWMQMAEDSWD